MAGASPGEAGTDEGADAEQPQEHRRGVSLGDEEEEADHQQCDGELGHCSIIPSARPAANPCIRVYPAYFWTSAISSCSFWKTPGWL